MFKDEYHPGVKKDLKKLDMDSKKVFVLMIGKRGDFYTLLKRRI